MATDKPRKRRGKNKNNQCSTEEQFSEPSIPTASNDHPPSPGRRFAIQMSELSEHNDFLFGMASFLMEQLSRAKFESLLNDYMESELFVIDGDSLIITCATNESLRRGQNLHFFFLVERFLLNLTNKGAKYSIVFFNDMEHLYTGCPDLISLRSQLMLHLENNTDITVHYFSNFLCEQWREFINHQALYFVMASDEGLNNEQTCFLNLFILHALGNQINVVLTAGQDSDNLRVFGYHVSATFHHRQYLQKNGAKIKKVFHKLITSFQTPERSNCLPYLQHLENVKKQVYHEISLLRTHLSDGSDIRILICAISCSMTLRIFNEAQRTPQGDVSFLAIDEVADLCRMMCLSEALMIVLPLSQRAKSRLINANWNMEAALILNMLKICEAFALNLLRTQCKKLAGSINWTYISNLSDDLLLKNIAYYCEKEMSTGCVPDIHLETGEEIEQVFRHIWDITLQLSQCGNQLQSYRLRTTRPFLSEDASVNVDMERIQSLGLIPVSSDIIDDYAGDIVNDLAVLTSDDPALASLVQAKPFDELTHWHSRRPLSDDYDRTKWEPIKDAYALRSYQRFQTFQRFYGKSLGMSMSKQIVLKSFTEINQKIHKAHGQKKETKMSKKDQIIEENLKKTRTLEEKKEIEKWKAKASSLAGEIRSDIFCGMRQAEQFISSLQTKTIKLQAQFHALETCFALWVNHCKANTDKETRDQRIVVEIMKLIQAIVNDNQDMSQREEQKKVSPFLIHLGFENLAEQLHYLQVTRSENKESKYAVGVGSSRFQMQYMGPYLKKDERTDPDPRIQHFIPDTWQRELLDVVDNNESAVIVAPTSSGKTYASYYCMEKVLTESNDGVVVYVAPTKALVNQVVATVINQFTKDLPKGVALCGVFTRDYRCDTLNSQVLVTVPQCLEILLLSPHRQAWVNRIKYMIFDEVHCLGGEIGAEVWEHILAMVRCPFLALSATISNPEHLTEWLQSVKKYWALHDEAEEHKLRPKAAKKKALKAERRSCRVRLVLHDRRYNDLEKFVCSVKGDEINFHHYHPCAALTISQIQESGIPKDLAFSPRESLQLYDAMVTTRPEWPRKAALDPENNVYLKDKLAITKIDAANYEEEVKKELSEWVKKGFNAEVSQVLKSLGHFLSSEMYCQRHFPNLVQRLRQLDKLPALFFAFDIKLVEQLAKELGQNLTKKSETMQTPKIVKEMQKLNMKGKRIEKTIKSSRKDESFIKEATAATVKQKYEKISKESPECSYANYGAVDSETLMEMTEQIKTVRHSEELISLAERGIGYHHGSMDYKARRFVEMLFRMGHIRVVTATSSLALGINMPCKSVVFLKDSSYLDALNYRQMAGRAGRRGLDLEGNVYFFNIPMTKVEMLIKSNVPELRGQFPLSISLVLRLMLLAAKADDKGDARAKVLSVLKHSLMSFKHPVATQMLKMFFVFSLQFLVHEGYLDKECDPLELTGLVTHLHYHEPSNFLFVSFLKKGLFHELCKPSTKYPGTFPDSVMETLMLVLAHLFGREYILSQKMKYMGPFFQSKVFLEKLPDDFAAVVEEHNRKVALIFGQCILTASKLADTEKEYQLPLSEINLSGKECMNSGLVHHLMSRSEGKSGISPFACLSGNTDHDLMTMKNINSMMLSTIQIPEKYFPIFYLEKTDACGRALILNSYALDFYKHGSIKAIVSDNGFIEGDAFYKLRDFSLSIAAISISLREMCEDEYDPVPLAFEQLREKFRQKLDLVK
ncbi:probable ATP-dependent RNA helicase DDX60 isoform X1 [Aquarana catesbeiana]|uniref:probable ATP-dependent RNA helicase DDX60 isoform X1 n=1 Tax=Aquarana catesbeiana TaxID=8400 RepID=UPI003CC961B2